MSDYSNTFRNGERVKFPAHTPPEPLTERELGTTLAALRYWQRHCARQMLTSRNRLDEDDLATDGGRFQPLSVQEIDALCVKLNP